MKPVVLLNTKPENCWPADLMRAWMDQAVELRAEMYTKSAVCAREHLRLDWIEEHIWREILDFATPAGNA